MVRRYNPETDFEEIQQWGKAWGQSYKKELFPEIGFIVPKIAAYFLYKTDSKVCFLENLISNPEGNPTERAEAIDRIVELILTHAKAQGFEVAYACTDIPAVVTRALKSNAKTKTKYVLIQKEL